MLNHQIVNISFILDPAEYGLPPEAVTACVLSMRHGDTGQHFSIIVDRAQGLLMISGFESLDGLVVVPETVFRWVRLGWIGEWFPGPFEWTPGYPHTDQTAPAALP